MYKNIGGKVKGLAIFAFVIGAIGSLVGAIVMWTVDMIAKGFGVLIGGCLSAWVSSWIIYCVGDTNQKVTALEQELLNLQQKAEKQEQRAFAAAKAEKAKQRMPEQIESEPQPAEKRRSVPDYTHVIRISEEKEKCGYCGTVQSAGRNVCWNCGAKFKRDADE